MSNNLSEIYVVERESLTREKREAQQRILRAALTGEDVDPSDLARTRGLVLREREDSIFSDAWPIIAVGILVIGFFDGRNPALLGLGLVLLLIAGAGRIWKNLALWGVHYQRNIDHDHVFPGEPVKVTITASNHKWLPLTWLRFRDILPVPPQTDAPDPQTAADVSEEYILINSYSMYAFEQIKRSVTLSFTKRGFYRLGPVTYQSGDVFTLFSTEREHDYLQTVVVYPQILPLDEIGLPPKEPFGELKVQHSLFDDPIKTKGIRDYQPQDRFRDVHWKATARRGHLQTKVYDPSTGMTLGVFLNVSTMSRHWMGHYPELLESAVSVAASVASYGAEQGWGVGVYANGAYPRSDQPIRVPPGRSPDQLTNVLEALAAVTAFATSSIEVMMLRESPRLPWVSTLVLVTAVIDEGIVAALLRLKEAGRRVALVSLAPEEPPPVLNEIVVYHYPVHPAGTSTAARSPASPYAKQEGNGVAPGTISFHV